MALIDLPDGRVLDVMVGEPPTATEESSGGNPALLFHHGTPGAAPPITSMRRAAQAHGLRLVTYSRAGYGSSGRDPGRTVADVAEDMAAVLDHVRADTCVTAGWSGGGPHALATAALLPDRVAGVLLIASVAPFDADGLDFLAGMGEQNVEEFDLAVQGESALRPYLDAIQPELSTTDAAGIVEELSTLLPDVDRAVLTDEFGADQAANFREALRLGVDGWLDDDLAFTRAWGFDPDDVSVPAFLWQGDADLMVPFAHGEWLAGRIPGVTAHLEAGEGHLSIGVGALDRMLDELVTTLR